LAGKAYVELKHDIIRGRFMPDEKLRVEHLKRDYGVSGGTLREALTMLIADRLVDSEGQRGFRVKPISPEEMIDLNRIRILLEKEAIRQSIEYGDEEWEAGVVSAYHVQSKAIRAFAANQDDIELYSNWERRHRAFHLALVSGARSEWLQYFLSLAYQQYERYRYLFLEVATKFSEGRDADSEHAAIVDAVIKRDGELAAQLIQVHVSRSIEEWESYFAQGGTLGSTGNPAAALSRPPNKRPKA
jgi:DNA-binding GntR family transcriptional regulator